MPETPDTPKVSMSRLFNMMAGTSTGALLASFLSMPNEDGTSNEYFANAAQKIYIEDGATVFMKIEISTFEYVLEMIAFIIVGIYAGYYVGERLYYNKEYEEQLNEILNHIHKRYKHEPIPEKENFSLHDKLMKGMKEQLISERQKL